MLYCVVELPGKSVTLPLKAIEMKKLRERLEDHLSRQQYKVQLESMSDSELQLKVSRTGSRTLVKVERHRHRPLEVVVDVNYTAAEVPTQVRSSRKNQNSSGMSYRWIWLLFIFGGVVISILSGIAKRLEQLMVSLGISETQLLIFFGLLLVIVPIAILFGLPWVRKQLSSQRLEFDKRVLGTIKSEIDHLQRELTATEVLRCWSCFKEITFEDRICPFCGMQQKK